ncbi:PIN domain-containing protein [Planomonospora sp. ID82291]|uniref:PIN domain-containing protein n=1 Tax=Planomonospora sp. ID82291 TaxID=2738136 RepID=UPI0018C40C61|nr:PIN domain-containing protein [Planomonospora sp. ID82291]MBG0818485.1 hypothetical protein [Planomonospora sp. ID82291]
MSDHTPTPRILDMSVLIEIARGDSDLIGLIQGYDAEGWPVIVPALAMAGAHADTHTEDAADLLTGLELLDSVMVAPLQGSEQAVALADVIARTGLDAFDAHTAAIANVSVCPILTLDHDKWQEPSRALDDPLHVIEIADPGP